MRKILTMISNGELGHSWKLSPEREIAKALDVGRSSVREALKSLKSLGIIGGADGPTAIFLVSKLAPHLLGPIAVAAYSYMALVPIIQPPII